MGPLKGQVNNDNLFLSAEAFNKTVNVKKVMLVG